VAIRLMKVDVEGFEAQVLEGAREVFAQCPPQAVLFELNERPEGAFQEQPVISFLLSHGYRLLRLPKCLLRMRAEFLPPAGQLPDQVEGHDFIALREDDDCEENLKRLKAQKEDDEGAKRPLKTAKPRHHNSISHPSHRQTAPMSRPLTHSVCPIRSFFVAR
jgi:hypothetical protein